MAFISSQVCLKKAVSDFRNLSSFHSFKQIYSGMRNYCHRQWKVGYKFEIKRRIKIARHSFCRAICQISAKLVQGLPLTPTPTTPPRGLLTGNSNCMQNLPKCSYRKTRKNRISTAMRSAIPRRQANKVLISKRKYQFS